MSDPLINSLVNDMTPVKTLSCKSLNITALFTFVVSAVIIITAFGVRKDFYEFIHTSSVLFKNGLFLSIFMWGLLLIHKLSRPSGTVTFVHMTPFILIPLGLFITGYIEPAKFSIAAFEGQILGMTGMGFHCLTTLTLASLAAMAILWRAWLKKTASTQPMLLGAISGLTSSSLIAFVYAFYCSSDYALYVSVYYGIPIMLMTGLGAILGHKKLAW
jgi:hypothetical protein